MSVICIIFFFKQKTAYEMRISDWSSDVCSSDLIESRLSTAVSRMAHIYKYTILQAVPDPRRGECVNVGVAVFLPDRVDVRFSDLAKVKAIARGDRKSVV